MKEAILEAVRNSSTPEEKPADLLLPREDSATLTPPDAATTSAHVQPVYSAPSKIQPPALPSADYARMLFDTYFNHIHGRPYYIIDEASARQGFINNRLPEHLTLAIFAVSARYTADYAVYLQTARNAQDYAKRARADLDIDEPSTEGLQTLLLLSQAMFQEGQGKKAYMYLTSAVSMAFALNLHRELPATSLLTPAEREGRRRLFWSCYLLDCFAACGSKRPSLISDECILLRLPTGSLQTNTIGYEGDFFPNHSNLQLMGGSGNAPLGGIGMLIGITRILGNTNRYLAAGGVKGDSHFPWHTSSTLSKIRQDLDLWAADTQDTFLSIETLFGQPDSVVLVISKLIYHLIHCLIYRAFLPIDLAELTQTSQHQSWQIEATNLCFLHANAITELVEIGKASGIVEWPAFVSYCVCTAGTIHVHGAHYRGQTGEVFSISAEFLSREVQQLTDLGYIWGGIQHQKDTLQTLYGAHSELVKSLATNPIRFSPVFQMEDFFERYPGYFFDGSHITLNDLTDNKNPAVKRTSPITTQPADVQPPLNRSYSEQQGHHQLPPPTATLASMTNRPSRKRKATGILDEQSSATSLPPANEHVSNQGSSTVNNQPPYIPTIPSHQQSDSIQFYSSLPTPATPSFSYGSGNAFVHGDFGPAAGNMMQHATGIAPEANRYDPMLSIPMHYDQAGNSTAATPRALLQPMAGSNDHDIIGMPRNSDQQEDTDPFLALLEQLAENEQNRGGPSELDFFLSGTT